MKFLGVAEAAYAEIRKALLAEDMSRAKLFLENCFPDMPEAAQRWLLERNNFPEFSDDGNTLYIGDHHA